MKKNSKVHIFCRVSSGTSRELLLYQAKRLKAYAQSHGMEIVTITLLDDTCGVYKVTLLNHLIYNIRRREIDYVLIWSFDRISPNIEEYEEFRMFCELKGVKILVLKDIEKESSNS